MRYRATRPGFVDNTRIRPGQEFASEVDCRPFAVPLDGPPAETAPAPAPESIEPAPAGEDECLCLPPLTAVVDDRSIDPLTDLGIGTSEELRKVLLAGGGDELVRTVPYFNERALAKAKERLKIGVES